MENSNGKIPLFSPNQPFYFRSQTTVNTSPFPNNRCRFNLNFSLQKSLSLSLSLAMASDSLRWKKIFNSLVHLLKSQQTQLETLAVERKILEDRIQIQHERWVSDVLLLKDHLSQMEMAFSEADLGRVLESAKAELMVGMKKKEAFLYKLRSESSKSDLGDMQRVLDFLSHKYSEQQIDKGKSGDGELKTVGNTKEEERNSKILREEIRKLKHTNKKLTSEKNTEVSALVSERNFVWNQFKKMESDYISILKSKRDEVEQANKTIETLQRSMEKLKSTSKTKDDVIVKLKADLAEREMDVDKRTKETSKLVKELELLKGSRNASLTPLVSCPKVGSSNRSFKSEDNVKNQKRHLVNKDSNGASDLAKSTDKVSSR
ncbi:uncharacterized protein LOC143866903 [Tasmannia lanceolata]|uniref:uncharacterized protein LOC143866903 n=1 Tax=Tasmannia lanceolata TaxID=3420 RepID=UPI0040644378